MTTSAAELFGMAWSTTGKTDGHADGAFQTSALKGQSLQQTSKPFCSTLPLFSPSTLQSLTHSPSLFQLGKRCVLGDCHLFHTRPFAIRFAVGILSHECLVPRRKPWQSCRDPLLFVAPPFKWRASLHSNCLLSNY